jgi:hypothetical protein
MQYIGELTGDQIINMIDEEIKLIDYTGDITLTNTTTKKTLIITTKNQPLIIIPKKPTQFLDLPVEIRQITPKKPTQFLDLPVEIRQITPKKPTEFLDLPVEIINIITKYAFNDDIKKIKKIFNNEYTNISNVILLKNMFGEYPKELILNDNIYKHNHSVSEISEDIKQNFINILKKNNIIKYFDFDIMFYSRIYDDLTIDINIKIHESYIKYNNYNDEFEKIFEEIYIDKNGCIYDDDYNRDLGELIGGIKYKDMYEIITHIKNIVYNYKPRPRLL